MAINTLATATLFQQTLDKVAVQEAVTGWMDANAGQVIYNGGAEVKIPKMSTDGLGDYDRDLGYPQGGVTLEYETKTMTQDRGRKFQLDAMEINENNFVTTGASVMGEFQRVSVIPEIDAYRLSSIATLAMTHDKFIDYGYTAAEGTILRKLKEGIATIRDNGYNGPLMIHATSDVITELEMALVGNIRSVEFSKGGIMTKVPGIDEVPIIPTPRSRMYSAIKIHDGKTEGQKKGGYEKASNGLDANFIILPTSTPIAVTKQDKMKIFDPDANQDADAWKMNYRRYHDIWVLDNKLDSIFVNIKDAKPTA